MALDLSRRLRPHTLADARDDYENLKAAQPTLQDFRKRAGLTALDRSFLHHRLKAKTRRHLSFFEAYQDPALRKRLTELVVQYKKKPLQAYPTPDDLLRAQYDVFQLYYGSVNQFKPLVAKWVYQRYAPTHGIFDPSAGWGGRALAALSLGIPYTGIDANRHLAPAYRQIHQLEPTADLHMIFQPAETVDFHAFDYDLVFTSPPYFTIEEYEQMPDYPTKQDFIDRFLVPVMRAAWRHLRRRGHMVLNMPKEMADALQPHLPPLYETVKMPIANRHPSNAVQQQRLGKQDTERFEVLYVWRKP
jgi:hypothetical protein